MGRRVLVARERCVWGRAGHGVCVEDEQRFMALYQAHAATVIGYLRRRAPEASDDLAAETFAVAWRRLGDVPADPLPWLLGVARRLLANERRRGRRLDALRRRLEGQPPPPPAAAAVGGVDPRVERALASLTTAEYEAVTLIAWEELSQHQAALVVGTTRAAFSMRLARARRRLEAQLTEDVMSVPARSEGTR